MAATVTPDMTKPRVIILGGCGFIGRNLIHYLVDNDLVSAVRVVDKVPPQTAWLNKVHRKSFDDPKVEFVSANLILPASCDTAFVDGNTFDLVVNCASETKPSQTELVYKEGIVKLLQNCASQAVKHKIKKFIEVSSGQMASSSKAPHTEEDTSDPWTGIARFKLQAEAELARIEGLNYCILRPAIVYGLGDRHGLAPRFVVGGVYKHMGEVMKLLWDKDLHLNTVHVTDVCRAIWFVASRNDTNGQVYNVVDDSDSTQGIITEIVSDLFGISHDYWGNTLSLICKTDMSSVVEEGNDKHLGPWAEACAAGGVENTPLTPYMDQEVLLNKHLYLDGSKLRSLGFMLTQPKVTKDTLKEVLDDHADMNLFPRFLLL